MTTFRTIAAVLAVMVCAGNARAAERSNLAANLEAGEKQTVVAYGTSLTAAGAWVAQLQEALNAKYPGLATVINSGASSMMSQWGVDNLETRVIEKKPDTVFIEFAINDAYLEYTTTVARARANLVTMIERIQKANPNCEVILMTMNPSIYLDGQDRPQTADYYQMYRDVAQERDLMLIDHYVPWKKILDADRDLFLRYVPDGLHPGTEGCAKVITPGILAALGIALPPGRAPGNDGKDETP